MPILSNTKYKGFNIELYQLPDKKDFIMTITKYRHYNEPNQEYYMHEMYAYSSEKKVALKKAKNYIDNLKQIHWKSSGLE